MILERFIPLSSLRFLGLIVFLLLAALLIAPYSQWAMWFGFAVAGYSVIANDSIQTLGTFISSNKKLPWWVLWMFAGGILATVLITGWYFHGGDFSWGRLDRIPAPTSFTPLMLCAPIVLLVITRLGFPVSTTFLILSIFSSQVVLETMLMKSFCGYIVSFIMAFGVWTLASQHITLKALKENHVAKWRILQFLSTGYLWIQWLKHDVANVVVFLPRSLPWTDMMIVVSYLVLMMGYLMFKQGGKIQKVVQEKKGTTDIRIATAIDFFYAIVLSIFKEINNIPMSTTWIFLGILAGRELAMAYFDNQYRKSPTHAKKLAKRDLIRASMGLLVSLIIVIFAVQL